MAAENLIYGYIVNEQEYPDQERIMDEGSKGDWVYVILEGNVKVKKNTPKGMITIDTLKEGDVFGEMAMLEKRKGKRSATVIADGPVKVGVLDRDRLEAELENVSPQLKELIKNLVERLAATTKQASELAS